MIPTQDSSPATAAGDAATPRLELARFTVYRGEIKAVRGIDLQLQPGRSIALVGANGAGKSTLVEALAGLVRSKGDVLLDGQAVRLSTPRRALASGIALSPANRGLFHRLTVAENLVVGGHSLSHAVLKERVAEQFDRFPSLQDRRQLPAGQLSGGERQMLSIAKALMTRPRLLLLDEPSRGLSPAAMSDLLGTLAELTAERVTVLVVDQAADWLYRGVDRLLVMANGKLIADTVADDASRDEVAAAYFDLR